MLINPYRFAGAYDSDAQTYITAVETADGQALETGVRNAINAFVVGCKADGIWTAIKASCILAGARTLAGALVPLVGTAPTNNNFVSGDYNRKTGLVGDGSTKYLNSNRSVTADPQDFCHISAFYGNSFGIAIGSAGGDDNATNSTVISTNPISGRLRASAYTSSSISVSANSFAGMSRTNSSNFVIRGGGQSLSYTSASGVFPGSGNLCTHRFAGATFNVYSSARISFYSIGESLNLALLDSRVTTLINALAAAIP